MSVPPSYAAIAYKICPARDWAAAVEAGVYAGSALDHADGYIHLSTPNQTRETARKWFAGQSGLVLVAIDLALLGDSLRWEPSRGGALFPHVYGPIPVAAARSVHALGLSADGAVVLPDEIP